MTDDGINVARAIKALKKDDFTLLIWLMDERERSQNRRRQQPKTEKSTDSRLKTNDIAAEIEDQIRALPRDVLNFFYDGSVRFVNSIIENDCPQSKLSIDDISLQSLKAVAMFSTLLIETDGASIDQKALFTVAQLLHDQLLRLHDESKVLASETQNAISLLCESCWKKNLNNSSDMLVTTLLPYLIVRSYKSLPNDHFQSKKHPIRRLFAMKDAFLLLDFDDENSELLMDILLRCYQHPNFLRSPDAVSFLGFVFTLHGPLVKEINATIRNFIPHQNKAALTKYGAIYFKAWVGSSNPKAQNRDIQHELEYDCLQKYIDHAVHAGSQGLFTAVRTILQPFFQNKRHAGVDDMLYRICSPILWRGITATNDSVRRQAAILLFDSFPLRDPKATHEAMELMLQRQFDAFETLLADPHPSVRVAAVHGVCNILSIYWDLLPAETIRCFISKLIVDLVNDVSSSSVRSAVFEGLRYVLDNHNSHDVLKPLLPMLGQLLHDRNERVRSEFAALLVRVKSIRNLHFYDIVSEKILLSRLVLDRDTPLVRQQLVLLFLNSYFPEGVGGASLVARCLTLVKKQPEAALVFYGSLANHVSVGSICKLAALLCRCSLNFVSRRLKVNAQEEDDEDEEFSPIGQVVLLQVIENLLQSVHKSVMFDERYGEAKQFLQEQISARNLEALLKAHGNSSQSTGDLALSAIWRIVGLMAPITNDTLLQLQLSAYSALNDHSGQTIFQSLISSLIEWNQLTLIVKRVEDTLVRWRDLDFPTNTSNSTKSTSPIAALNIVEVLLQAESPSITYSLLRRLKTLLDGCVTAACTTLSHSTNNHGIFRLLEVYVKLLVNSEDVRIREDAGVLMETKKIRMCSLETLLEIQPSQAFTPPSKLLLILAIVIEILIKRLQAEKNTKSDLSKKRSRSQAASRTNSSIDNTSNAVLSCRWRNLFSLISVLVNECILIILSREGESEDGNSFLSIAISTFAEALNTMDQLEVFERCIFYQSCHFWNVLSTSKSNNRKCNDLNKMLYNSILRSFTRNELICKDLWKPAQPIDLDVS